MSSRGPDGERTRTPAIPDRFWQDVWGSASLPAGLPPASLNAPDICVPVRRLYERWGSNTNPSHFLLLLEGAVNAAKGRIEVFRAPMSVSRLQGHVQNALAGSSDDAIQEAIQVFVSPLREVRLS
jgi:alkylhydroperoxidase/carboxymuconolactone decarboxylase family protein YurZ